MIRRTRVELVVVVALALTAPGCCPVPEPNGLRGSLDFAFASKDVARGLTVQQVVMQTRVRSGSECATSRRAADFTAASLEVGASGGIAIGAVAPAGENDGSSDFVFPVRCESSIGRREVEVRVMSDGRPRYEDAFEVACTPAAALTLTPRNVGACRSHLGGGTLTFDKRLLAADGTRLAGSGLRVHAEDAARVALEDERPDALDVRLLGPGDGFSLVAGDASARVELAVLADDSPLWTLGLRRVSPEQLAHDYVGLEATAGDGVCGLGACALEVTGAEGTATGCRWVAPAAEAPREVRACVTARGRAVCEDFTL